MRTAATAIAAHELSDWPQVVFKLKHCMEAFLRTRRCCAVMHWFKIPFFALFLGATFLSANVQAQPNGTLVMGNKESALGYYLSQQMTYSHVGIVLDGKVCESDWPHVKCTPIGSWQQPGTNYDWYAPDRPYTARETRRLRRFVNRTLGRPYRLKNYLFPNTPRTQSGWCSTWAARALNATGRYRIRRREAWDPEMLHNQVRQDYHYINSTHR